MLRSRILAAATAGALMLGMSVGGAGAAFADEAPPVETPIVEETTTQESPAAESRTEAPVELAPAAKPDDVGPPGEPGPSGEVGGQPEDAGDKVFVCKFVGTPGVDERLQTGDNPINVSVNAIPDEAVVGAFFADDQGRSFVLALDIGQEEPDVSDCPPAVGPEDVEPAASVEQIDCLDDELIGGVITVDLTKMGVDYTVEDSEGNTVAFDGTTGETGMLEPGDYTVFGVDGDSEDEYDASDYEAEFTIDAFTDDCGDLPTFANWTAAVTVTNEGCVNFVITSGTINVVFPDGTDENPMPIRYFIDYEGENQQELTAPYTVVPAGDYVVTAVVTDENDSVNDSGTSAEFLVTVTGVNAEDCAPQVDCVVVIWEMPSWVDYYTPTWPQSFVSVHESDCSSTPIDPDDFPVPDDCGTQYQLDKYYDSEKTRALIAGGVLLGYGPEEDLVPDMYGALVKNPDCELDAVVVPEVTSNDMCVDGLQPVADFTVTASANVSYIYTVNGAEPSIAIVFPDGEESVTIAVSAGDTVVVTAVAAEGFVLPEGYMPWEKEFTESELCVDLSPLANWTAGATGSNQTCVPPVMTAGSITVQLSVGPEDNPNPVRYFINYDAPGERELTSAATPVAPGSYTVTAVATVPTDSINSSGNTDEFAVMVGAAADQNCELNTLADLDTLAFTGAGEFANWLGVLAVLMTVAGVGFIARRHRVEV